MSSDWHHRGRRDRGYRQAAKWNSSRSHVEDSRVSQRYSWDLRNGCRGRSRTRSRSNSRNGRAWKYGGSDRHNGAAIPKNGNRNGLKHFTGHRPRSDSRRRRHRHSHSDSREKSRALGGNLKKPVPVKELPCSDSDSGSRSGSDTNQDEIIHFDWHPGQILQSRYKVTELLGDGTFGRVVLCYDLQNQCRIAIKIIRDVKRYMENAKIEADILKDIREADPQNQSKCALMYDTFVHQTRFYCLVFEALGMSLYDFLKNNGFRGYFMQDIQSYAKQGLEGLAFLHERLKLTHTDLKPENILLQSMEPPREVMFPRADFSLSRGGGSKQCQPSVPYKRPVNSLIKLIDFGNATYEKERHSSIINTRQYRGPEVLLSLGWDELSDLWSLGSILMELYTGEQLFETHEEMEHLALMEQILGPLSTDMLIAAVQKTGDRFVAQDRYGRLCLNWPGAAASSSSIEHVRAQRLLPEQVMEKHRGFAMLVGELLTLDPRRRPSAAEALKNSFFRERYPD